MFFSRSTMPWRSSWNSALAHEMPAGAVARHQGVLDQPRARREAAEDDVLLEPADHLGLFFLARERGALSGDDLRFMGVASDHVGKSARRGISLSIMRGHFALACRVSMRQIIKY